jgi:AbrB family looped-hinge helix DNA binding protein
MNKASKFTRVTEKGQSTVPHNIREYLGVKTGDYIFYKIDEDGRVVLGKVQIGLESIETNKIKKEKKERTK